MIHFAPRSINSLSTEIAGIDREYDNCSDVWCKGESEGFFTETCLA